MQLSKWCVYWWTGSMTRHHAVLPCSIPTFPQQEAVFQQYSLIFDLVFPLTLFWILEKEKSCKNNCFRYFTYFHEAWNIWYHSTFLRSLISFILIKTESFSTNCTKYWKLSSVSHETCITATATEMTWAVKDLVVLHIGTTAILSSAYH